MQAGWLRMGKRRTLRPYRMVRTAGVAAERWGGPVARATGVSVRSQFRHMCWLALRHGIPPEIYYRYRFFERDRRSQASRYLHWQEHNPVLNLLATLQATAGVDLLEDKEAFAAWCKANDLPHPPVLATFSSGRMAPDSELPGRDLFSKPSDDRGGAGATLWPATRDGRYVGPDGVVLDRSDLQAELESRSLARPQMVQERLVNHSTVRPVSPGGLCTIRLVTARAPGGDIVLLSSTLGIPMAGSPVDNFHAGGICAAIDPATGRVGPGVRAAPEECLNTYDHHPDTGAPIAGLVLPQWDEVATLGRRAHELVPGVAFVGWDVALTDRGPLLLEANPRWDAAMPQVPDGTPLGATPFVPWLLDYLRRPTAS